MRWARGLALIGVGLVVVLGGAIGLLALRPASTAAIEGPGSIAALEVVDLGGVPQTVLLRAHDQSAPVLLYVHGGPGAGQLPVAPYYSGQLEKNFVVVHWDQTGAGASCEGADWDSLSLDRTVSNTIELATWLAARFGRSDKILLVGHSWGSIVGARAVQRRPDLFHAYVGVGQLVHGARNEELSYAWVRSEAERRGDSEALAELAGVAPPYADNDGLRTQRRWLVRYRGSLYDLDGARPALWPTLFGPEYTLTTRLSYGACIDASLDAMWSEVGAVDFLTQIPELRVPVFFFSGGHDWNTPTSLVEEWAADLEAPSVETIAFPDAGHFIPIEAPDDFQRALIDRVLPTIRLIPTQGDVLPGRLG